MRRHLAGAIVALLAAASPAAAADPASGTVSNASPVVTWAGTSSGGFVTTFAQIFVTAAGEDMPCQAPSCDTFTLEVKDVADLNVKVASEQPITYLQIVKPDGSVVYNNGIETAGDPDNETKLRIKRAAVGTYQIQAATNTTDPNYPYTGEAVLGTPAAAAAPAPTVATPAPAEPAPAAPATVSAKAGKLSARKLAKTRRLPLTLTTTAPLSGVKVVLAAKGKAIATGTLASLNGTAKYSLRLRRKLKPGRYDLAVEGADAAGRKAGTKLTVKVAR